MRLDAEQIAAVCLGTVRVEETETGVRLFRFTKEQEEIYRQTNVGFYTRTFATAGIKLCFETDSKALFLKVNVEPGSARQFFSFDVFVDKTVVGYLDNFSEVVLPRNYAGMQLPMGEFSGNFELGSGKKKVTIYMPWSVAAEIREISIDDGAFIVPVKPVKKLLAFGDSITQGADALRPSNRYTTKLAEALNAEEINKGIGGERFFPELAKCREKFEPDYITVAYGTNDWDHIGEETFKKNCRDFFEALSERYPNAKIVAITPIWRKDNAESRVFGPFHKVAEDIREIVEGFDNITCICGYDFVPQDETYFGDMHLHPNDAGMEYYAKKLYVQMTDGS